jgi:exopolyphosphatase/guanosine-5'-triphosphate,3'-diphosphate pyrophosphatase
VDTGAEQGERAERRKVAIIDLGSNAGRMAVFEVEPGRTLAQVDELRGNVRLGAQAGPGAAIRPEAFARGLEVLGGFAGYCQAAGIRQVRAVATSAVREAGNGAAFVAAVAARTGLALEVLSGEDEARHGVVAVANAHHLREALVLDLGGGSAQLSRMSARRFVGGRSWPIGAVRMTEAFLGSDPPRRRDARALRAHVRDAVEAAPPAGLGDGVPLVGMGGTIRNLARIDQARRGDLPAPLHGHVLERDAVEAVVEDLLGKDLEARRATPGLNDDRADVIVAGALVVEALLEVTRAPYLLVSGHGLREGLVYPFLLPEREPPLVDDVREFGLWSLARRWGQDERHVRHVRALALELFDGLAAVHGLGEAERGLLSAAAVLHDVGMAVEYHAHHRHGLYLVMSGPLPGFGHRDQALIALLVQHHRKGKPGPQGLEGLLAPGDLDRVAALAGMLRVAEHLERSKAQRVARVEVRLSPGRAELVARAHGDASLELREAAARTDLLAAALGVEVVVGAPVPA